MKKILLLTVLITSCLFSNTYSQKAKVKTFNVPDKEWKLAIDLQGFKVKGQETYPNSEGLQMAAVNEKENLNLTVYIEKAPHDGDKLACRDFYWSKAEKSPLAKENLKKYETEHLAIVAHDTKEFQGQEVNFRSVNAYLAHEGYWIDVHISKVFYTENHKALFEKILNSISIEK